MSIQVEDIFAKRFTVLQELGQGGMGRVLKAYDKLEGRTVAIKQVKNTNFLQLHDDPYETIHSSQVALIQEFQILASLRHPNIISVLDYGLEKPAEGNPSPYFVMEYMQGGRGIVEAAHRLTIPQKLGLALQMIQALAYLHRRDILHLDLKPANVLCDSEDVKVVDFGIASKLGSSQLLMGTLPYIAPERLKGEKAVPASDLFAVGIIIYEMLFYSHPFGDEKISKLLENLLEGQPKLDVVTTLKLDDPEWEAQLSAKYGPEFFNLRLHYILGRLLDKKPEMRYQDAKSLINDLSELIPPSGEADSPEIRESFIQAARFVGRERELSLLLKSLVDSMKGAGSLWLVGGESGIGKSRLIEEFRIHALTQGSLVLIGRGVKGGGTPYHYWRPVLKHLCLLMDLTDLEAAILKPVVSDIASLLQRPVMDAPQVNQQETQRRFIQTVSNLIQRYQGSLVIILEDLHWASETLEVLKALNFENQSLFVLGTYRDDECPQLPKDFPTAKLIRLLPLQRNDISQLSTSILGEAGKHHRIVELLLRETEGNVYFLVEVIRALAEMAGKLDNIASLALPAKVFARGIQDIVERRLERVPAYCLQLLRLAAVTGRELDLKLLSNIVEADKELLPISLESWLGVCTDAAILDVQDNVWRFVHEQLREGMLSKSGSEDLSHLHCLVAESIERVYPDNESLARKLAYHWQSGKQARKEFAAVRLAAKFATEHSLSLDTIELLERAVTLYHELEEDDKPWLAKIYYHLGRVYTYKGLYENAANAYEKANQLLDIIHDPSLEVEVLKGQAHLPLWQGQLDEALVNTHKFLEFATKAHYVSHQVDAHNYLNAIYMMRRENEPAQFHIDMAWALVKDSNDLWQQAVIKNAMGEFSASLEQHAIALEHYNDAVAAFQSFGDQYAYTAVTINMGHCYLALQNLAAARTAYRNALQIAVTVHGMLPLSLGAIAGYALLLALEGDALEAAALASFVVKHPSSYHDPARTAEQALKEVVKQIEESQIQEASLKYESKDYRGIVDSLLS